MSESKQIRKSAASHEEKASVIITSLHDHISQRGTVEPRHLTGDTHHIMATRQHPRGELAVLSCILMHLDAKAHTLQIICSSDKMHQLDIR